MSFIERHTISLTGTTSGSLTTFSDEVANGKIHSIKYTRPGSTPLSSSADFTVTTDETSQSVWAQSNVDATTTVMPRAATHDITGVANTDGTTGTAAILEPIAIANERIKVVVASPSTDGTTLGTLDVLVA